jgi:nucleotide-binding universal stress UspA family protein
MRKILIAFDGNHFSEGAFEFARKLSKTESILLTGIFLPEVDYANLWSYSGGMNSPIMMPPVSEEVKINSKKTVELFTEACQKAEIEFRIHKRLFDFTLPELKKESSFADLLIVGSEKFYENLGTDGLNDFLRDTLHEVLCPVVVVPEKYHFPYNNVLTYDGTPSSVYAIKQFAYLFPDLADNDSILVYASPDERIEVPERKNIEDLVNCHYPELKILNLNINPSKHFAEWLHEKKGSILISGAFGRSDLSRLFKKSFVQDVIKEHRLPVFIAHK